MKLEKVFIRNFRAIGRDGLELSFSNQRSTIVGENNVGKY